MIYIPTPLSKFRMHPGNDQLRYTTIIIGSICWALTIRAAIEDNVYLHDLQIRRRVIAEWLKMASGVIHIGTEIPEVWEDTELQDLLCVFAAMADALRRDCRIAFDIDTTLVLQMDEV